MRKRALPISSGFHTVSAHREQREVLDAQLILYAPLGDEHPDFNDQLTDITQVSPADIAERSDLSRVDFILITEAMAELPPPLRAILEQVYIEGKSLAEVEKGLPTLEGRSRRVLGKATTALIHLFTEKQKEAEARIVQLPADAFRPA